MLPPDTDYAPVSSPDGRCASEAPEQVAFLRPADDLLTAPLSEVMIRVTRRLGERRWRYLAGPPAEYEPPLYRQLATWLDEHHYWSLSTWAVSLAFYASQGIPPARYAKDVIRRARGHQLNAARGRPWLKQR